LSNNFFDRFEIAPKAEHGVEYVAKVLVVDDEPDQRDSIRIHLPQNSEVVTARNGIEALEILKKDPSIDVVVLDAQMPEMDGRELQRHIAVEHPDIFSIMYTAHARDYASQDLHTQEFGLAAWIDKENPDLLRSEVQIACDKAVNKRINDFFGNVTSVAQQKALIWTADYLSKPHDRFPERSPIPGPKEARAYCIATTYPKGSNKVNVDYVFGARELNYIFGLKGKDVVTFADGPGQESLEIAEFGANVVSIDACVHMVDWARETFGTDVVDYRFGNIFNIAKEHPDIRNVDLVRIQNSSHQLKTQDDLYKMFKAAYEILKVGGSFYGTDYRRNDLNALLLAQRLISTHPLVRSHLVRSFRACWTEEEFVEVLGEFKNRVYCRIIRPEDDFMLHNSTEVMNIRKYIHGTDDYMKLLKRDPFPHGQDENFSDRFLMTKLK